MNNNNIAGCPLGSFIYMLMMPALCSQWIMGSKYRTKIRDRYGLVDAPYQDVVSHIFCSSCSLCQEFRELKNRGLDPALGTKTKILPLIISFLNYMCDSAGSILG